ncbi:hypothetical protein D8B22_12135 [Verminephrobacter aporrectodeae subsp. tuberculatae]|nr:hypothetical protein [Verminephrobacter aporrectodeae subsp. tuberculatae]MCW8164351.1 hypothetical protein [Verminephrobacter aporrectodeae subsp. tuberculatae]MCW8169836.1 hypothetical protein [Verminephrobacter aporrectodeae subsp. tuberculatae]
MRDCRRDDHGHAVLRRSRDCPPADGRHAFRHAPCAGLQSPPARYLGDHRCDSVGAHRCTRRHGAFRDQTRVTNRIKNMNHFKTLSQYVLALLLAAGPLQALAHSSTDGGRFLAGLVHPVEGADHLLAMVAVGIVSSLMGRRHIFLVPASFVAMMVFGAFAGFLQWSFPGADLWIALSVLGLGICITILAKRVPCVLIYMAVALFGMSHGYAHGLGMPNSASPAFYSFGFITTTSLLHLFGVGIGELCIRQDVLTRWLRMGGGAMSLAGVWYTLQAILDMF